MPNYFCSSCGFGNEYVFNKPDFCGKCRTSLSSVIVAAKPKRRVVVEAVEEDDEDEVEVIRIPKRKTSVSARRNRDDDEDEESDDDLALLEGINLKNIKIGIASNPARESYKLTEEFIRSNKDSYIPPTRGSNIQGDIRDEIFRVSNTKNITSE